LIAIALLCASVVGLLSCEEESIPTYSAGCPDVAINENLYPIFYWGYGTLQDWVPNVGNPASDVGSPQWICPDSILVASITTHDGVTTIGAFSVHIDPATLAYEGVTEYPYEYASGIYFIRWDNESASVFVLDSPAPSTSRIVRCHLSSAGLVPDEEVVGPAWKPRYMCPWPGHDGVVFSGVDPLSGIGGVYWRRPGGMADSLLFAPTGPEILASRFSITADGENLLLGLDLAGSRTCQLVSVSTQTPGVQRVIVTRAKYSLQAEANPADPDIAAYVYHFIGDDTDPPQDIVEIVRLSTGDSIKLDVRTYPFPSTCRFPRVESVSWDPTGRDLAIASGAEDSEGQRYRFRLWAFRNVPIK
jgi:hypothetical protein